MTTTNARELTVHLARLLRRERAAMADFLLVLGDFDRRRLWMELGHSSLFYFLHRELGLSKGAAFYRKTAAELVQRYPEILDPLRDGRLCITSIAELSKVITPENRDEVLPRFFHRSRREAKEIAAEVRPADTTPRWDLVTVPRNERRPDDTLENSPRAAAAPPACSAGPARAVQPAEPFARHQEITGLAVRGAPAEPDASRAPERAPHDGAPHDRRATAEPLTAELRRLHVTVSRRFLEKLEAARAALSHACPEGTTEEILEAGLDLVLAEHAKRKGLVATPRPTQRPAKRDHVPAAVKRAVWERDGGRCQWPLASGGSCGSTLRVEFDHEIPLARGGPSTVENIRLLCAAHNRIAARRAFGDSWMDRYARHPSAQRATPSAAPP